MDNKKFLVTDCDLIDFFLIGFLEKFYAVDRFLMVGEKLPKIHRGIDIPPAYQAGLSARY